jgi:hypothetical protein
VIVNNVMGSANEAWWSRYYFLIHRFVSRCSTHLSVESSCLTRLRPRLALVPGALTMLVALRVNFDKLLSPRGSESGTQSKLSRSESLSISSVLLLFTSSSFICIHLIVMGASQSQPRAMSPEPYMSPEERSQAQAEASVMCSRSIDGVLMGSRCGLNSRLLWTSGSRTNKGSHHHRGPATRHRRPASQRR